MNKGDYSVEFEVITPGLAGEIEQQFEGIHFHVSQHPRLALFSKNHCFVLRQHNAIIAYAIVEVYRFHKAVLEFGPILSSANVNLHEVFQQLFIVLRKNSIWYLCYQGASEALNNYIPTPYIIQRTAGWATAFKYIALSPAALIGSFRENHQRNIKKAQRQQIEAKTLSTEGEFKQLIGIFHLMYSTRKIHYYKNSLEKELWALFHYIQETGNGIILIAQFNSQILGGIMITHNWNSAYYYFGASNRTSKLPIMHLLFLKAFEHLTLKGIVSFDFGGYDALEMDNQFIALNNFKDGFGVQVHQYPDKLCIATHKIGGPFIAWLMQTKKSVLQIWGKHIS